MNIFFLKPKQKWHLYNYHTLRQAMEIMEYHKYSSIPMINREGKYVGTITEGDLLWGLKKLNILNLKEAEDIAITKIARRADYRPVSADSNMEDLMEKAMDQNFVPVIDDQQNFIGIITRKDIIGYCYEKIKKIAN
ncbi:MAG: CBS domain-containing protein [Coprococcus comes]